MRTFTLAAVLTISAAATPAPAQMTDMHMSMPMKPSHFAMVHQEYTTNHQFLVKMMSVPSPIPYEKYFTVRLAVFDARNPSMRIPDAHVAIFAGMRHGMRTGFAHGMESAPKVTTHDGVTTISGMYFHMMGPWTLKTTVNADGRTGVAYFQMPCCAQ